MALIDTRAFISQDDEDVYELILRSNFDLEGPIFVRAVGDSGQEIDLAIESARDVNGRDIQSRANQLIGLKLKKEEPLKLSLRCVKPGKYSIGAFAR